LAGLVQTIKQIVGLTPQMEDEDYIVDDLNELMDDEDEQQAYQ